MQSHKTRVTSMVSRPVSGHSFHICTMITPYIQTRIGVITKRNLGAGIQAFHVANRWQIKRAGENWRRYSKHIRNKQESLYSWGALNAMKTLTKWLLQSTRRTSTSPVLNLLITVSVQLFVRQTMGMALYPK